MDIVIITMTKWDGMYSSTILAMAKEMAKQHRVFYIDHPYTMKDVAYGFKSILKSHRRSALLSWKPVVFRPPGHPPGFIAVTLPPVVPINFLPNGSAYEFLSAQNDSILNAGLQQVLNEHNVTKYILLNSFNPFYFRSIKLDPRPIRRIYQSRDHIEGEPYIARHGPRLEAEQIQLSDMAIATSSILAKKLSSKTRSVQFIENGVDVDLFFSKKNEACPDDLPKGKPLVLYVGNMSELRIDLNLLNDLVRNAPQYNWVFIGDKRFNDPRWDMNPNTFFLGPKLYNDLPAYMSSAACCIIPFALNDLTAHIYPLKINEYLAAGAPVISTRFSKDISSFENIISIADTSEAFLQSVTNSINADTQEAKCARQEHARSASWEARVEKFWTLVMN